jgi:hypothetical protein
MLSRPGPLPSGPAWSFELKWDGFRAIVSTEDGLAVRSRRGWNMTHALPELRELPSGFVLDGELVAWKGSEPYSPLVCRRVLDRDMSVPMTFVIFDLLCRDGVNLTRRPYRERRDQLEALKLDRGAWTTCERFDDGRALFTAVCELGFEGVVAKNHSSLYRPNDRGWVKVKNLNYTARALVASLRKVVAVPPSSSDRSRGNGVLGASQKVGSQILFVGVSLGSRILVFRVSLSLLCRLSLLVGGSRRHAGGRRSLPYTGHRVGVVAPIFDLCHRPKGSAWASHATAEPWGFAHVSNLARVREHEQDSHQPLVH